MIVKRNRIISLRLSEEMYQAINKQADLKKISKESFIRFSIAQELNSLSFSLKRVKAK